MNKKLLIGIGILILIGVLFISMNKKSPTGKMIDEFDDVKMLLSDISKNAQFYDYEGIKFFAIKTNDRTVKTAFDACDVCYKARKGYSQKGKDMVCNNCGNHYAISGLGTMNLRGGGCWPGYLPSRVEKDYLVIKKSDLEKGRYRFR